MQRNDFGSLFARVLLAAAWYCTAGLIAAAEEPSKVKQPLGPGTDFSPVVEKVTPSVVTIFTTKTVKPNSNIEGLLDDPVLQRFFGQQGKSQKMRGLGSGVIVSADGFILTSNHVIDGADEILVGMGSEKNERKAKKVGADPGTDLALLKIDGKDLPMLTFADSDKLRPGQIVLAVGSPFGLTQTVTMGIVSAVGRGGLGIIDFANFIQTDAAINMGNSGGALVDTEGHLVGINSAILSRTGTNQGIGFAIPSNLAREVLPSLREKGHVVRGYLGTVLQSLTPELVSALKLKEEAGALVGEVEPKSPAEKAGIKNGDVITSINGQKVTDPRELRQMIGTMAPGTKAKLEVFRENGKKSVDVQLAEMPPPAPEDSTDQPQQTRATQAPKILGGVVIADIDEEVRQAVNAPKELQGTVIVEIDPSSPAGQAGLRQGDIIRELNKRPIKNAQEFVTISQSLKADEKVLLQVWSQGKSGYVALQR
jgi:serine protease Do